MSTAYKTRLDVQTILRTVILDGLTQLGQTGWGCMEFANASFQKADKIILLNLISTSRLGWQGGDYAMVTIDEDEKVRRKEELIELQSWQVHTILKRDSTTNDNSILAEDIASMLISWFNGPGAQALRSNGVATERVDAENLIVYNDNSDLYQKRAVFTVKLQVPKELTIVQNVVDILHPDTMPV